MAMPATCVLSGTPASISASEAPHTVAIDEEPFDSRMSETTRIVYGKSLLRRQHGLDRPLGEGAVTDVAAGRRAEPPDLPDRERREVVVQHEVSVRLALQRLDLLLVRLGAERGRDQGLRLAAGEERRAVGSRQVRHLDGDRPDLVALRPSTRDPALDDQPRTSAFSTASNASRTARLLGSSTPSALLDLLDDPVHGLGPALLLVSGERDGQLGRRQARHSAVSSTSRPAAGRTPSAACAACAGQSFCARASRLHIPWPNAIASSICLLGTLVRPRLDHQHARPRCRRSTSSRLEHLCCVVVGFATAGRRPGPPARPPIGPSNGMPDRQSAAEAPFMARTVRIVSPDRPR
jgi:hypothetical protein